MKVYTVMTRDVLTVAPRTPLKDVARLLVDNRVSGVPVVDDDGTVLGVVSEADVLEKERAAGNVKHEARDAADAMTAPPVVIRPHRPLAEAAALMLDRGVNRLPVVDDHGRLVGIVTRADLVRAFVRSDDDIAKEICNDIILRTLWNSPDRFHVDVDDGEVTIAGEMSDAASAAMLVGFVERVPGVVGVRSRITWPS